jgi:glycerol-3-phosphate O-acyltransferase
VIVRFGRPFDPFGNDITDDGESIDRAGRLVDPASFIRGADGEVCDDDQRDAEYTRALGRRLGAVYPQLTVFHSTHLLARVLYDELARRAGTRDIYRLMRVAPTSCTVPVSDAIDGVTRLRARLVAHPAYGAEHPGYIAQSSAEKVDDALRGLSTFHTRTIVERRGDSLQISDVKLLFYYQNRTAHIPPESAA